MSKPWSILAGSVFLPLMARKPDMPDAYVVPALNLSFALDPADASVMLLTLTPNSPEFGPIVQRFRSNGAPLGPPEYPAPVTSEFDAKANPDADPSKEAATDRAAPRGGSKNKGRDADTTG